MLYLWWTELALGRVFLTAPYVSLSVLFHQYFILFLLLYVALNSMKERQSLILSGECSFNTGEHSTEKSFPVSRQSSNQAVNSPVLVPSPFSYHHLQYELLFNFQIRTPITLQL